MACAAPMGVSLTIWKRLMNNLLTAPLPVQLTGCNLLPFSLPHPDVWSGASDPSTEEAETPELMGLTGKSV